MQSGFLGKKERNHAYMCGLYISGGFPNGSVVKNPPASKRYGFDPGVEMISWRREQQSTPVFLPGESHGQRSLMGYGPQCHKDLHMPDATWNAHTHFPS